MRRHQIEQGRRPRRRKPLLQTLVFVFIGGVAAFIAVHVVAPEQARQLRLTLAEMVGWKHSQFPESQRTYEQQQEENERNLR